MSIEEDLENLLRLKIKAYSSAEACNGAVRLGRTRSPEEESAILEGRKADEKTREVRSSMAAAARRLPDYCYTVKVGATAAPFAEQAAPPLSNVDARLELFATVKKSFKMFLLTSRMERRLRKLKGRAQDYRADDEQRPLCAPPLSLVTLKLSIEKGATNLVDASSHHTDSYRIPPLNNFSAPVCAKRTPFAFKLLGFTQAFPEFSLDLCQNMQTEQEALQPLAAAGPAVVADAESTAITFAKPANALVEASAESTYLLLPSDRVEPPTRYTVQRGGYNAEHSSARQTVRNLKAYSVSMGYFDPALGRCPKVSMHVSKGELDSDEDEQPPNPPPGYPVPVTWGVPRRGAKASDVNSSDNTLSLNTFVNTFPV